MSRGFPLRFSAVWFSGFRGFRLRADIGARTGVESLWAILSRVVSGPRVRGGDCPQPSHTSAFRGRPGPCVFSLSVRFKRGKRWAILRRSVPWFRVRGLDCPHFPHFPLGGAGSGRRLLIHIIRFFHIFFFQGGGSSSGGLPPAFRASSGARHPRDRWGLTRLNSSAKASTRRFVLTRSSGMSQHP